MKLSKWMFGAMSVALMASCSDDREIQPASGPEVVGSEGYISITIGMPTEPVSRATVGENDTNGSFNDQFNDGVEREYKVNNAAIIFFTGATEKGAKFYKAYNVSGTFDKRPQEQITANRAATFPVDFAKDTNEQLWALAILNYGNIFTLSENVTDDDGKKIGATLKINGIEVTSDCTIEEFMKLTTDKALYSGNPGEETNFFMTNSPYARVQGGTIEPSFSESGSNYFRLLADVDRAKIFETEKQAEDNPAAEIFVERALAKVQVIADKDVLSAALPNGIAVQEIKWMIDNTEPQTYLIRNLESVKDGYGITDIPTWASYKNDNSDNYRFIGQVPFKNLAKYRTYFCVDPNGDGIALAGEGQTQSYLQNVQDITDVTKLKLRDTKNAQYCKENTFSVTNMNYLNTTRAIIEVTFKDKDGNTPTFYTIGLDNTHQFTYENAARHLAVEVLSNEYLRKAWETYFKTSSTEEYHNNASTLNLKYSSGNAATLTAENEWMLLTFSNKDARLTLSDIVLYNGEGVAINGTTTCLSQEDKAKAIKEINETMVIKAYSNGKSYYAVRIQHFGDDLTPWSTEEDVTPTTLEAYGDGTLEAVKKNYLGRYGVVRNNWYQLEISSINNFGEPKHTDLPLDGTPDDKVVKEESISCKVNILAWALRRQNVEL